MFNRYSVWFVCRVSRLKDISTLYILLLTPDFSSRDVFVLQFIFVTGWRVFLSLTSGWTRRSCVSRSHLRYRRFLRSVCRRPTGPSLRVADLACSRNLSETASPSSSRSPTGNWLYVHRQACSCGHFV